MDIIIVTKRNDTHEWEREGARGQRERGARGQVLVRQAKLGRMGWSLRKSGLKLRKELSG